MRKIIIIIIENKTITPTLNEHRAYGCEAVHRVLLRTTMRVCSFRGVPTRGYTVNVVGVCCSNIRAQTIMRFGAWRSTGRSRPKQKRSINHSIDCHTILNGNVFRTDDNNNYCQCIRFKYYVYNNHITDHGFYRIPPLYVTTYLPRAYSNNNDMYTPIRIAIVESATWVYFRVRGRGEEEGVGTHMSFASYRFLVWSISRQTCSPCFNILILLLFPSRHRHGPNPTIPRATATVFAAHKRTRQ